MTASEQKSSAAAVPVEREVVITRVFDAPRDLVFQAWTDPKHMAHWWGPAGYTNPVCEMDVRPGGAWRIVMRAPDGADSPVSGVYREVVAPERLVFTNIAKHPDGNIILEGLTTATFAEDGAGKTRLTLNIRAVASPPATERMHEGWKQSLERLAQHVSEKSDRELVFTRLFDAPRALVFKMWTDPRHIVEWWGPRGFTTTSQGMDARPGGVWRFVMHGPDGVDYKNKIVYLEVAEPERLVYKHTGVEEGYEPVRFQVTVGFEESGCKTKLTMRMLFESAAECQNVVKKYGADKGAVQTLERLQEYLSALS